MKKIFAILCAALMAISLMIPASAEDENPIRVVSDGAEVLFDVPPQIINDRTMVPMRAIYEAMGATVTWDETTRTARGTKDGITVSMTIGDPQMTINETIVTMDAPPVIIDGRTLAPARFVAEAFGYKVEWDSVARLVMIYQENLPVYAAFPHIPDFGKIFGKAPYSQNIRSGFAHITYFFEETDIAQEKLMLFSQTMAILNYAVDNEGFEGEMTEYGEGTLRYIKDGIDMAEFFVLAEAITTTDPELHPQLLCLNVIIPLGTDEEVMKTENDYRARLDQILAASYPFEILTTEDPVFVTIDVKDYGAIRLELYPNIAPIAVSNFVYLANQGFYDGLIFHRVIEGFMIQGGCPIGNGTGNPGYAIKGEFSLNNVENNLNHTKGVISMARAQDYNSAGSQFFIMHEDAPYLDGAYAAFGRVVNGQEIVDKIAETETDGQDRPTQDVVIQSVRVEK